MPMTKAELAAEALRLPLEDRLSLAESLWDSVENDAGSLPLHDWQRRILDERLESARQDPDAWLTWEEVKARVFASASRQRGE